MAGGEDCRKEMVRGWVMGEVRWAADWGPEPEGRRGQPISIAILGLCELRHKETPTILVELPLAIRLLSVLVCAQSYSSNSRPRRQQHKKNKKTTTASTATPPHIPIHASTWADLPLMPLTLPLTKAPASLPGCVPPTLESTAQSLGPDAMQRPQRHEGMLDQLLPTPVPSVHPIRIARSSTHRIPLHHTC